MSKTSYSSSDHAARTALRSEAAKKAGISIDRATFAYNDDIHTGRKAAVVHPTLSAKHVGKRESRDSDVHPEAVPIGLTLDTTGSMQDVPKYLQKELSKLMGVFLADKASGKKYLGEKGTPAIMISAVDDWVNGSRAGALQISQFEPDIVVDDNLTNLWLTNGGGGGVSESPALTRESYILALYAAARHTAHDHFDKRGLKGCWFIIGDEASYTKVTPAEIKDVFGEDIPSDVTIETLVEEASTLYNLFFIMPNQTSHWGEAGILNFWRKLLPQGHVIELDDPTKICETIAGCVALCADYASLDDLKADGVAAGGALTALSKVSAAGAVGKRGQFNASALPPLAGDPGSTERL